MAKSVDHTVSSSVCFLSYTSFNPLNPKSSKTFLSLPLFFLLKDDNITSYFSSLKNFYVEHIFTH